MNETQRTRLFIVSQILIFSLFAIRLLSEISVVVNNWANDLVDPMLVYFTTLMFWNIIFGRPAPRVLCFIAGVGSGLFLEFLQLYQVQLLNFPKGTFDPVDVALFIFGGFLALAIDTRLIRRA